MRSIWAESLNAVRPRPFDRSTGPMVVLDEAHAKWLYHIGQQVEYIGQPIWEPWRAWAMARDERPSLHRSETELQFLTYPLPTHLVTGSAVWCRNLDVVATAVSLVAEGGVRLDASTLDPVYDPDHPIYYSNDGWETWGAVSCATVNVVWPGVTGTSVQLAYRSPALTPVTLSGSSACQFKPLWNGWDEWGRLLDLPRLDGENNRLYNERLESRMAAVGSPDTTGVAMDVARRIGKLEYHSWSYVPLAVSHLVWLKDEGSGPTCAQGSFTAGTASTSATGLRGTCLELATSQIATVVWSDAMTELWDSTFGVSVWVAPSTTAGGPQYILRRDDLSLWIDDEVVMAVVDGATVQSVYPANTRWHHLSLDCDGINLRLGIDGQIRDLASLSYTGSGTTDWTLGGSYAGRIDELRICAEAFPTHRMAYRQLIATDGWPAVVAGSNGPMDGLERIEDDHLSEDSDGAWRGTYYIRAPLLVRESEEILEGATLSAGRLTLPSRTSGMAIRTPVATYQARRWYGAEGVVPDQLPPGEYRVYVAYQVRAQSLSDYRVDYLTDARGLLTSDGEALLSQLGEPVVWETRRWDENLYLYGTAPPFAPAQTTYDQDLVYD